MRKVFESKFHSRRGREFRVEVYDNESSVLAWSWTSSETEVLDFQEGGLDISWDLSEDNVYAPIVSSTLRTNLIIRTREQKRFLNNLKICDDFQFLIKVYVQKGASFQPYWFGALTPSAIEYEHGVDPRTCSLTWTDGINVLKERRFQDEHGDLIHNGRELRRHIGYCLNRLPTIGLYDNDNDTIMHSMCDLYHEDMDYNGVIKDPLRYTLFRTDRYYSSRTAANSLGKGFFIKNSAISCYDVLQQIMLAFNLRFFHAQGRYNAVSPTFALNDVVAGAIDPQVYRTSRYRYNKGLLIEGSVPANTFGDSNAILTADAIIEPFDIDIDATYNVAAGSMETMRHPVHQAMITHTEGGSQLIFPSVDRVYIAQNWYNGSAHSNQPPSGQFKILPLGLNINTLAALSPYGNVKGPYYPNQIFEEFYSGESAMFGPLDTTDLNGSQSDTAPVVITAGTGFRIKGIIRGAFPSPRNADNSSLNPVLRKNKMLGAKPIVSMKLRVGSYYLKQDLQALGADDFSGDLVPDDWGEIHVSEFAVGVPGTNLQYYPVIPAADATWTTNSADTFDFHFIQDGKTRKQNIQGDYEPIQCPKLIRETYDADGNIQEVEYIGGLWTQNKDGEDTNELEYNSQSRQLWGEDGTAVPYRLSRLETEFDLLVPALPDAALDQEGVEISFSVYAYDANNDLLGDDVLTIDGTTGDPSPSNNAGAGDVWGGFTPYIKNLQVFLGGGEVESDIIYTSTVPDHSDVIDIGSTVVGGSPAGVGGNNNGIQIQIPPIGDGVNTQNTYTRDQDWKSQTYGELGRTNQQLLQRTVQSYTQMYGKVRPVLALDLFEKPDRAIDIIDVGKRFRYKYYNIETDVASTIHMCCVGLSHNLHEGLIRFRGLVTDATRTDLITEAEDPKGPADFVGGTGGGGGGIAEVFGGVKSRLRVSDISPANQTKLDLINLNATEDGVDSIDGFTGGGGGISAADQLKLDAITMNAAGTEISDFSVASGDAPLDADEVDDTNSGHKFATQSQLNEITAATSSINDILTVFKETTTGDGAGVYMNTSATDESHVSVTSTAGKLQAGARTAVALTETSPGSIQLNVQAGATGSEAQVTAVQISGNPTVNTKATVNITSGDFRVSSPTQFNQGVTFAGGSNTVTFTAGTSGIDYNDLNNSPTVPTATSQLTNDSGFVTTDTNTNIGDTNLTLSADRTLTCSANDLTLNNPGSFIITNSAGATVFEVAPGSPSSVQVNGNFNVDSAQVTGGSIRLEEANLLGSNYIELKAPISITNNVTLTFPDGAGTSGQVLQTNGSGTLTWTDKLGQQNPLVKGALSIGRITVGNTPKLYIKGEDDLAGVALQAPETISTDVTFTLPGADGTSGQVLQTDGSGNLSFATAGGGGGGGMTQTPFFQISGRVQWSSSYAGRRMTMGNTSYGPFNWYLHSQIVNGTAQTYSASDAVDTTTKTMGNYYIYNAGAAMPSDSKKVRVKFAGRFNNQIANGSGTVGFSVWHCANMTSGSYTTNDTIRLIAKSADITPTTSSLVVWEEEFVSSTAYSGGRIMIFCEHRSGTLSSTAYCYGNWSVFLES